MRIGRGAYSEVFGHDNIAIKIMKPEDLSSALTEIIITRACDHPNVIKLNKFILGDNIQLYMDRYECNLSDYKYQPTQIKSLAIDILSALSYIHARGIIHADLRPNNILIACERAVLCDFGISCLEGGELYGNKQTITYRAPEMPSSGVICDYSSAIDMWSMGCVLYFLIKAFPLFIYRDSIKGSTEYIWAMFSIDETPPSGSRLTKLLSIDTAHIEHVIRSRMGAKAYLHVDIMQIIYECLRIDPSQRITASDALRRLFVDPPNPDHITLPSLQPLDLPSDITQLCDPACLRVASHVYQKYNVATEKYKYAAIYIAHAINVCPPLRNQLLEHIGVDDLYSAVNDILTALDGKIFT
jgi:serine/threonine protein kinase